jgi:iron complex transport system ATP-binding protein
MSEVLLEARAVCGGYHTETVVHDVSVAVAGGEWLTILGPNGSGKSTLLRLLSRLLAARGGSVLLAGVPLDHQAPDLIAQRLAVLPQQQPVPPGLTVRSFVDLGRSPYQRWWKWQASDQDRVTVAEALHLTDLTQLADRRIEELSGGERQRAYLALALAQATDVLLLDEPTTFLDVRYQLEVLDLLKRLNRVRRFALVTVLHELNLAARYSDRLALLCDGRLRAIGPTIEVLTPANIADVFGVQATLYDTPVGLQICPLAPCAETTSAA